MTSTSGELLAAWAPGLAQLRRYERGWLRGDLVAGLTVGALLITQCMAYAPIAGLPPSAALRGATIGIPVYVLLGSSRHLAIGPDPGTATHGGGVEPLPGAWSLPGPRALIEANPSVLDAPHHDYPAWDRIIPVNTPIYAVRGGTVVNVEAWPHNWWTSGCGTIGGGACSTWRGSDDPGC